MTGPHRTRQRSERRQPQPQPAETKTVAFRVSWDMLRQLLCLTPDVDATTVRLDQDGMVQFDLQIPHAPDGATELAVSYSRTSHGVRARSSFLIKQ